MDTLLSAHAALQKKDISSVELTKHYLDRMKKYSHFNAYVLPTEEKALAQAQKSDERLARGEGRSLEGLPLAIKDIFCTKGIRTTACSKILNDFIPPYESTVTQNLWDAGAVCLGKTNMDEFAMGSTNLTSYFGPCINPWKTQNGKELVPGGSSGGSAAAVAADLCLAALGTDTGGSVRQPASYCGIVGLKPTYGRCSRYGIVAYASSLDQAGPMTKTVADAALLFSFMSSYDTKDATSSSHPTYVFEKPKGCVKGMRIGILQEYMEGLEEDVKRLFLQSITWLKEAGASVREVSLPSAKLSLPTYYIIAPAEASANLARYDGVRYGYRAEEIKNLTELYEKTRQEGFGPEVKRRLMIGTYVLSAGYYDAYYVKAQKICRLIKADFSRVFQEVDVIVTPTAPSVATAIDEPVTDPVQIYLNDIFTTTINLAGLPALSVPMGVNKEGLPLGFQIIAPLFEEERLFEAGTVIEQNLGLLKPFF